jgi:hypothetical protein
MKNSMKGLVRNTLGMITILAAIPASAYKGGDGTGNGGGLAEKNVVYAYVHLEDYLKGCVSSSECGLNSSENRLVQGLLSSLDEEQSVPDQLEFHSESEPGYRDFFLIDGQVKVARTGSEIGSTIYFNLDLIYTRASGRLEPMGIAEAAGILTHELGHHQGQYSELALNTLAVKVQSHIERLGEVPEQAPATPLYVCGADNWAGRLFWAFGYAPRVVQRRAVDKCRYLSNFRPGSCAPLGCRIR